MELKTVDPLSASDSVERTAVSAWMSLLVTQYGRNQPVLKSAAQLKINVINKEL